MTADPNGVQSIDRAVAILTAFTPQQPTIGVVELSRMTGLSRSTTHRLLASLLSHGLVRQVAAGDKYTLGPTVLSLASVADKSMDLRWMAGDLMERLRDLGEETVGLHVYRPPRWRITLDQVESLHALRRTYTDLGRPIPVHQGAPGKVLLAHLPAPVVDRVLAGPMESATPRTVVDPEALRREFEEIAARGYAISVEGRVPGIAAIAVPVFDHRSGVAAALSISGPTVRLNEARLHHLAGTARQIAQEFSERLGYRRL
jgi:IclR family transcriptional regulator, acetate operon repressor